MHGVGIGACLQSINVCHPACRSPGVVQLERATLLRELLSHAQDRRDPDAARQQDRPFGVLVQREVVARNADVQFVSDLDAIHERGRAAARLRFPQDADAVAGRLARKVVQGILANQPARQMDIDMRAGVERRQCASVHGSKFIAGGSFGQLPAGGDLYSHERFHH
jgi:hypothetical protein